MASRDRLDDIVALDHEPKVDDARPGGSFLPVVALVLSQFAAIPCAGASETPGRGEVAVTTAAGVVANRREVIDQLVQAVAAQARDREILSGIVEAPPPRDGAPAGPGRRPEQLPGLDDPSSAFRRAVVRRMFPGNGDGEPQQRPEWIATPASMARTVANAEAAGRDWSFGWIRLRSGARLEDAADALAELGAAVEGQSGAWVRARLPGNADSLRAIAEIPGIADVGTPLPSAKIPASFAVEARGRPAHEVVPVFVTLAAADDANARWRHELERVGAVVGAWDRDTRSYVANIRYGMLDDLAALDFVAAIEPVPVVEAMNDTAAPAMGADAYRAYADGQGWTGAVGESVAIGVMDTGLNINHVDIESGRKSVCGANFIPSPSEEQDLWIDAYGHGTHVTATVVGNGAAERRYAGMAPLVRHIRFAKVLSSRGFSVGTSVLDGMDFLAERSECAAGGWSADRVVPAVVNMSLAATSRRWEGRDVSARKLDAVVYGGRQLYVVAYANASIRGFSAYGAAKNSLAVGAAWDSGELVGFSSEGPTADGRLAPLVVGTGVNVYSAMGGGRRVGYGRKSGTSMSSPAVAGVAALVMDGREGFAGRPTLTRALLMASAVKPDAWLSARDAFPSDNTDGPGAVNARYGLGKVSASTSVRDRNEADGWRSGGVADFHIPHGHHAAHEFEVPDGASRLDVVMTWDEPPADVIANTVLNDLDLWVDADADCGAARCGEYSSTSRRDNIEWVVVRKPRPGTWRATVVAERVHGQQPRAALAYTVIRGPAAPQLSVVADPDELGEDGEVTLTVATDGYVAAGTRLAMDCRESDGGLCGVSATWELLDGVPAGQSGVFEEGESLALGEIRPGAPRTVRVRVEPSPGPQEDLHFVVTGWNAEGDSTVVQGPGNPHAAPEPPANDAFGAARDLGGDVAGDLLRATTEPGEPAFERGTPRPAGSVWYRWHATAAGPAHFDVALDGAFANAARVDDLLETRVDVYLAAGDIAATAGNAVASAPWGASFVAEQDAEYAVRVAARGRGAPFTLRWRRGGPPANDAFAAAEDLDGGDEGFAAGTNAGATLDQGESFGGLAATVWYRWEAPADGWWEFRSSAVHLKVLAFQVAGSNPSIGDIRLASGFPEDRARFPARAGDTYRIAVAAPDAESAGTGFELSWSPVEANRLNDLLGNAYSYPGSETGSRYVSVGRSETVSPGEPRESGVRTEWWSWTAPATAEYTWRLRSPSAGIRLAAFALAATGTDLVALGGTAGRRLDELTFAAGEDAEYRFAVGVEPGDAAFRSASLRATAVWGPTPPNDDRPGAVLLTDASGTARGSNRFATVVPQERIHDVGHSSLWWEFEAPAAGWYVFRLVETSAPFALSAYASAAADVASGRLELVASSHFEDSGDGPAIWLEAAEAGDRFLLRVGTRGDAEGGDFALRWEPAAPPVRLRYAGLAAEGRHQGDDGSSVKLSRFVSLALHPGGTTLYAKTREGLAVFDRDAEGMLGFSGLLRDPGERLLLWDAPRNRLLSFGGCVVRSYRPSDGDPLNLEPAVESMIDGDPVCSDWRVDTDDRVFADRWGSFVFLLRGTYVSVYSVGEDGGLTRAHRYGYGSTVTDAALSRDGGLLYMSSRWTGRPLVLLAVGEDGELDEVGAAPIPFGVYALALDDDGGRVFVWGWDEAAVVDVSDPERPTVLGTSIELPREVPWRSPRCRFAVARTAGVAAEAFCANGAGYAVERRDGGLAVADLVADWHPNRHGDVVPPFRSVEGFAASADGRHAYLAAAEHGILVFERVNNAVPDDHADSRDAATLAGAPPWSGRGELVGAEDVDVFRIDVQGPGTLTVRTTGGTDTHGTLTDADGVGLASDADSGDGLNFEIALAVSAGAHYVEVRASGGGGPYTLTVVFLAEGATAPDAPTGLAASPGGGEATLSWTASTDDGGSAVLRHEYRVRIGDGAYGDWTAIPNSAPGGANALGYTVTGLANGERAFFQVRAVNAAGPSDPSNEADATPQGFSAQRVITTAVYSAEFVHAADLDGDGDADVLSASQVDDKIAWYENEGGGTFSAQRVITTAADAAQSVHAADLDGDGDADVLSASQVDDKIAWYENRGGGTFSAQRVITTAADGAYSVHAADLDGDGDADVLSASQVDDKIAWYENRGGGTFSAQRIITTAADHAHSVHAADLDGDGDADVLSASQEDGKIAWYENGGGGTFSAQRVITADARGPWSVHAADLDGDGDADVLSASGWDGKIAWYENGGGGTFSAQRVITTAADGALSVHAADLDGDGDVDVLSASIWDDKIAWYENEGGGTFSAQRVVATVDGANSVHAADLDGDGDADLLSASEDDDMIAWYENQLEHGDDHRDTAGEALLVTVLPAFLHGVLESAGDLDVFRIATGAGTLRAYSNGPTDTFGRLFDGTGARLASNDDGGASANFRVETTVAAGVHYVEVRGFADAQTGPYTLSIEFVADDGGVVGAVPDAPTGLAASPGGGEVALSWTASADDGGSAVLRHEYRVGTGDGVYVGWRAIPDSAPGGANATGYTVTGLANGERAFFQVRAVNAAGPSAPSNEADATPQGAFSGPRVVTTAADGARSVHAADLDGDGDADVLSASEVDDKIAWYENEGGGTFSAPRVVTTAADGAHSVHAADLDGDGDADVLSASEVDDKIAWYENEGGGTFSAPRVVTTAADGAHSVHAADLDGDGDADVLSASASDDKIAWYENEGGGTFSAQRVVTTAADGAHSVHAADLDGDGDADVLSASASDDKIAWYENEGGGTFSAQRVVTTAADGASSVHAADLDGDGDADVLSASASDDKIAWYENEGGGTFSAQRVVTAEADGASSVHAVDLDGDGDADVLSASASDDKIAWYENEGGGTFSAQRVVTAEADGARSVHAADLDGDGDADVLSASASDDRVAWYENQSNHGDDHRDTAGEALLVTVLPAFLHGVLESAGDLDVFRIATGAGTLRAYSNGPTDTFGRLFDGTGARLASNDDGGASANFRVETTVAAGVHYVEVRGFADAQTGPYTLSIEFVADDGTGQSAVVSVCGRTPTVRNGLVAAVGVGGCSGVTARMLADVATLDLSDSGITALRKGDFAGMANLRELSLGDAALSRLPAGIFDGLSSLEHLSLSGTDVPALPEGVFGDLRRLRTLSLADNALAALPPGAFAGMRNLERLDLSGNRLETLPPDVFAGLWHLAELRLDGNALGGLDAAVFSDLDALRLVDLRFNRLAALPPALFGGLRLDALRLDGNPGAPFAVDFAVERADRSDPAAPAPGTVRLRFAAGAILDRLPFDLSVPAGAQRGALSADALMIEAGADAGRPVAVVQAASAGATWVHGGRPQRIAGAFGGLQARIAVPVALFAPTSNRMPRRVGRLRGHSTTVGVPLALHRTEPACCEVADVAAYFADDDGDTLSYAAVSLDPQVATAVLAGTRLVFEPTAPGRTVVRLTATDAEGMRAAREIDLDVLPRPDPGGFDIDVVFVGDPAPARREAVLEAARRWEQVVVGDLGDIDFSGSPAVLGCGGGPVFGGVLDDIRIHVRDGRNPRAGPRRIRADGGLPLDACVWLMADAQPGRAGPVPGGPVHQIGHALGFGTLWGGLVRSGTVPSFEGALAKRVFNAADGTQGAHLPVSDDEAHWSPSWAVHRHGPSVVADVMTAPVPMQSSAGRGAVVRYAISETTIQSMADLGYLVDAGRADAMPVAGARTSPGRHRSEPVGDAHQVSDAWTGLVEIVDADGNTVGRTQGL